jgi:hypothetical protein
MTRTALLLLSLSWLLQGCAAEPGPRSPLDQWRQGLERYVWEQGNGDPAVLRDVSWDDVHPGFAILGDPLPDHSTDVFGLFVGRPRVGPRAYFVFLTAVVQNELIRDTRAVALDVDAGQFLWQEGPPDEAQTLLYRQAQPTASPASVPQFPSRDDAFDVDAGDGQIIITHRQSGATWRVDLPDASATASPPTRPPAPRTAAAPGPRAPASPYPPPRRAAAPADTSSTRPSGS